ncbi:hypothetical protein B0T21DRAFT_90894 [Apiosordaria backusii]|uniref:Uncharacterized protein n=1 Tax=Apiosordaria backusii TaxID=314023 RepID=A0AA40K3K8_9PEZI|nr:hypothetical protein B0T21DRAFT_90894 [Apiosordaria backusii]
MRLLPFLPLLGLAAATAITAPRATTGTETSLEPYEFRAVKPRGTVRLSDLLNPIIGFLECSQGDATVQLLCRLVAAKVNEALAANNIKVDHSGLLFQYNDPTNIKIDTGHSCTVTAEITGSQANAKLLAEAGIKFSGNPISLSNPGLFVADLPVELWARSDIKQKFGSRLLGKCIGAGSDSFHVSGSLATRAQLAVLFTFAPAPLKRDAAGNYILTIRPITKVAAQLADTNIKFNISGVSFLNGLATAILGGTSSILKAVTHIFKGDSLKAVWNDVLRSVIDVTAGALLATPFDLLDNLVELLANSVIEEKTKGLNTAYSGELEKALRTKVSQALGLNANGERSFTLKKDIVDLVAALGERSPELWLPDKPANFCSSDAQCDDGRYCNGVEKCINEVCIGGFEPCARVDAVCIEASKTCRIQRPTCGTGRCQIPRDVDELEKIEAY